MMTCIPRHGIARACFATLLAVTVHSVSAADVEEPQFGGDLWSRPRLTGDWGGAARSTGRQGTDV